MLLDKLSRMKACSDAKDWVRSMNGTAPELLWQQCDRGDWMLWLIGKLDVDRKRLVLATCQCARLSLHFVPADEDRPRKAIETAEAWVRGEADLEDVRHAAADAYAADAAATAYAAATATAYAAYAAAATATAYAAADAYAADAAATARADYLKQCADIARRHFSYDEVYVAMFKQE